MSESGPPRKQSDLTIPIDRSKLPPISVREVAAMGLDPEHPEVRAALAATRAEMSERITMVSCARCAAAPCPCCGMIGMVTPERDAEWRAQDAGEAES